MMELEFVGVMHIETCIIWVKKQPLHVRKFCGHLLLTFLIHCRFSRNGTLIQLPPNFYALFPNLNIDGEIWHGRGKFLESQLVLLSPLKPSMISFR